MMGNIEMIVDSTTCETLSCPACGNDEGEVFCSTSRAPVLCHLRYTDADESRAAPTGRISLARCGNCGLVYNRDFEPAKMSYEVSYDNALHFSAHFREYARGLAADLCQRHELQDDIVVDIGCGDGYFLNLLCETGANRGWGFDPTAYKSLETSADVRLIRGYFDAGQLPERPRLISCRHVLEHLPEPQPLLGEIRQACEPGRTVVYFEVPDARFTLEQGGLWDILYEHCSYYTPSTIRHLFERNGFQVNRVGSSYHGQFLQLEAVAVEPGVPSESTDSVTARPVSDTAESVTTFSDQFRQSIAEWQDRFQTLRRDGKQVVLWGAGTKGVMFLNMVGCCDAVSGVVDLNPGKHGTFIAGTEVSVISPESLTVNRPDVVVLTNPAYRDEISRHLSSLGLEPSLLSL